MKNFCPVCGAVLKESSDSCSICDTRVVWHDNMPVQVIDTKEKTKAINISIAIFVAMAFTLFAVLYI